MAVEQQASEADAPKPAVTMELPLLEGELGFNGPLRLSIPLPAANITLDLPVTLNGTTRLHMQGTQCARIDAQGTIAAPLALQLQLAHGLGRLDVDAELDGDATLSMASPSNHGQIQAHLRAVGPATLVLDLPHSSGRIDARTTLNTPLTLSLLLPDGRIRLGLHDTLTLRTTLRVQLPHGGHVEAAGPVDVRLDGMLFLPSGRGEIQATAPIRTLVHVKRLVLPQLRTPLSLDIKVDGAAEVTTELPGLGKRLRAHFTAALPTAPLLGLLRGELERHVEVEHVQLLTPCLKSPHDLLLPLVIVARRGVQARLELTAMLRIDPRSKRVTLRSLQAEGLNAAGRAAAWLYVNPHLLRGLRNSVLFEPSDVLPPEVRVEALGFKAAGRDELSVEGVLVWESTIRE